MNFFENLAIKNTSDTPQESGGSTEGSSFSTFPSNDSDNISVSTSDSNAYREYQDTVNSYNTHLVDEKNLSFELQELEKQQETAHQEVSKVEDLITKKEGEREQYYQASLKRVKGQCETEALKRKKDLLAREKAVQTQKENIELDRKNLEEQKESTLANKEALGVADPKLQEFLVQGKTRKYMSRKQKKLISKPVEEFCQSSGINTVNQLIEMENALKKSQLVEIINEPGRGIGYGVKRFAMITDAVLTVVVAVILLLAATILPQAGDMLGPIISFWMIGGSVGLIAMIIQRDEIGCLWWMPVFLATAVSGILAYHFYWPKILQNQLVSYESVQQMLLWILFHALWFSWVTFFWIWFGHFWKLWAVLPFMKGCILKGGFSASNKEEGTCQGIYCYLNHDSLTEYLTRSDREKLVAKLEDQIQSDNQQLNQIQEELIRISLTYEEVEKFGAEIGEKIRQIEAEQSKGYRTTEMEYSWQLFLEDKKKLNQYDEEINQLMKEKEKLQSAQIKHNQKCKEAEEKVRLAKETIDEANKILRSWQKTPSLEDCQWKLQPIFCMEGVERASVINYNAKSLALFYQGVSRDQPEFYDPVYMLQDVIYSLFFGIYKMNASSLIQLNVIDPIAGGLALSTNLNFSKMYPKGVKDDGTSPEPTEYIHNYSSATIRNLNESINAQFNKVSEYISANQKEVSELALSNVEKRSVSVHLANQLIGHNKNYKGKPFIYYICLFVVPREEDEMRQTFLQLPEGIHNLLRGQYSSLRGFIPIFLVDKQSIHKNWKDWVNLCAGKYEIDLESGLVEERK